MMANVVNGNNEEPNEFDEKVIEKLFPKCRPRVNKNIREKSNSRKTKSARYKVSEKQSTLINLNEKYETVTNINNLNLIDFELDQLNENNCSEMNKTQAILNDNDNSDESQGGNMTIIDSGIGSASSKDVSFKLDQLLLSPNEECLPFHNKPFVGDVDSDNEESSSSEVKTKESRIEIAGGREIFSASRSKLTKKRHTHHTSHNTNSTVTSTTNDEAKENSRSSFRGKYKGKRNNTTQTLNKYPLNTSATKIEDKQSARNISSSSSSASPVQQPHKTLYTKMTGSSRENSQSKPVHKSSGILVYEERAHNEKSAIVYDDIDDAAEQSRPLANFSQKLLVKPLNSETNCESSSPSASPNSGRSSLVTAYDSKAATKESLARNSSDEETSDDYECHLQSKPTSELNATQNSTEPPSPVRESGIARVIGNVPIARYEGSPRRYGPKPPGYPQRIINPEDLAVSYSTKPEPKATAEISCDELVKSILSIPLPNQDSLTSSDDNSKSSTQDTEYVDKTNNDKTHNSIATTTNNKEEYGFGDLEYKLYRMDASGNSYVAKRLATLSAANSEDERALGASPSKVSNTNNIVLPHENELILLHERVHQHILKEKLSSDSASVSACLGNEQETELEGQLIDDARKFTLSPETTDCDSNEIESELSMEGSLHSSSKMASCMPILEDGLSSGIPSSDSELEEDDANSSLTLAYVKKQISDIEEELAAKINQKLVKDTCQNGRTNLSNSPKFLSEKHRKYNDDFSYAMNSEASQTRKLISSESRISLKFENTDAKQARRTLINNNSRCINNATCQQDDTTSSEAIWVPRRPQNNYPNCNKMNSTDENQQKPPDTHPHDEECDTDQETDRLLGAQRNDDHGFYDEKINETKRKSQTTKEVLIHEPAVLIEGVLFRARYLGSTQLVCEGQPTKATRMMQAEEAVSRIKAPEGENQPSTDVDLFISTEKIMVLNTDLKEIMMDHALRTISYIADIGDLLVLMARRRVMNNLEEAAESNFKRMPKMICHVFESEEAQFIAQSIGQAFQVAYMEFLKANGIEDSSFVKEMDYQEVLNSQEIFGNELEMFAKKEKQKEVIVPKQKGEIVGMVIVESGWGSMLPTVVIANMSPHGPAARCGQLNIGDQIIAINGVSLVGLPLSTCQNYIKNTKNQSVVKLTVVPCPPVVEVKIKRPDTKYQLGFSVQNGVICSLLRGGIAERGGVRVGHRIIEINGQSVVAVPHDRIVNLLATSVGEIHMKTMPTSMFRLLTGQETPTYM